MRDFKSLGNCDVELGALTVRVGRNGSGKSNFLDALRFVSDELWTSAGAVVVDRRNLDLVRKGEGSPRGFEIDLDLDVGNGRRVAYGIECRSRGDQWPELIGEHLELKEADNEVVAFYVINNGQIIKSSESVMPPVADGRLYLANAAGLPVFREVYDALLGMRFYDLSPMSMSAVRKPSAVKVLEDDGGNIASVIARLGSERPRVKERILGYLATIVSGLEDVRRLPLGLFETIEFVQTIPGSDAPQTFHATSMSDGTLRALGALIAINQSVEGTNPVRLVGIEKPEAALHPAAAGALMDALREAAARRQVIVTTHSPDLLDQIDPDADRLLVAQIGDGGTMIGPIDRSSYSYEVIKEHLYSPGELLGMDHLEPNWLELERQRKPIGSVGSSQ